MPHALHEPDCSLGERSLLALALLDELGNVQDRQNYDPSCGSLIGLPVLIFDFSRESIVR